MSTQLPFNTLHTYKMDIEEQLEHLDEMDNLSQLILLKQESSHILIHGLMPSASWFHARFRNILLYQSIDWKDMAAQFENKNHQIYTSSTTIYMIINHILKEYETKETYDLTVYSQLLHLIHDLWVTYSTTYMGEETDLDIIDLVAGMMHM